MKKEIVKNLITAQLGITSLLLAIEGCEDKLGKDMENLVATANERINETIWIFRTLINTKGNK